MQVNCSSSDGEEKEQEDEDYVIDNGSDEDDDDDMHTLVNQYRTRRTSRRINYNEGSDCEIEALEEEADNIRLRPRNGQRRRSRRNRTRQANQMITESHALDIGTDDEGENQEDDVFAQMTDVNLEEQKMLMAALTGQPYDGEMPDYQTLDNRRKQVEQRSMSPGAVERRRLREEQDQAFQESLARDQEKQQMEEIRIREELEREKSIKEEEEQKKRKLYDLIDKKKARLPDEPAQEDENSFVLVIRMPGGARLKRRFSKQESLQVS